MVDLLNSNTKTLKVNYSVYFNWDKKKNLTGSPTSHGV